MTYEVLTIGKLKKLLTQVGKEYDGDKTPVYSGDFEGNFTHMKHTLMKDDNLRAVFLGYEMHENMGDM